MEVSSHALHQARVAEVRFHTTAFTNLSRDHLDYHGTLADYGAAKELLFRQSGVAHAILNVTDPYVREAATRLPAGVALTTVWCASDGETQPALHPPLRPWKSFLHAQHVAATPTGLVISGASDRGPFELRSRLVGRFNAENLLVVLGLLLAQQVELADALAALAVATPPPGRMETFRAGADQPTVIVDYAHTPDALAKVLAAARAHCTGRLYCVFGCGGDRDTGKRAEMGAIAESLADRLVLTDDNPRTEDGDAIIAMIRAGLGDATRATVERDRARAIAFAVCEARAGDVVVVAGKGHEDYQIYGTERRAFSDREVVTRCLGERA